MKRRGPKSYGWCLKHYRHALLNLDNILALFGNELIDIGAVDVWAREHYRAAYLTPGRSHIALIFALRDMVEWSAREGATLCNDRRVREILIGKADHRTLEDIALALGFKGRHHLTREWWPRSVEFAAAIFARRFLAQGTAAETQISAVPSQGATDS